MTTFCIFSFLFFLDTLFLYCDNKPCTLIDIHIEVVITVSPISSCVVSFHSLCTYFLLIVCNLLFLFHTKMPWWILFKVFQKYRFSKSFMPWTLFLQNFSRVCVRIDFIIFNMWVWVEWFMTSLICSFICCDFVTDCQRERLLGHMWIMLGTYVNIELANPLTKCTLLVIW